MALKVTELARQVDPDAQAAPRARGSAVFSEREDLVVVGAGTVGSALVELLLRQQLGGGWPRGRIYCLDADALEPHNVTKSALYTVDDIGLPKVVAAAQWARSLGGEVRFTALPVRVQDVGLAPFLGAAAVLIAGDNHWCKIVASRNSWRSGVPVIMVGEVAGLDSYSSRYRYFTPGARFPYADHVGADDPPCLECGYTRGQYDQLEVRFPCAGRAVDGAGTGGVRTRGPATRLSVSFRLAASMVEDAEILSRAISGLAGSAPGSAPNDSTSATGTNTTRDQRGPVGARGGANGSQPNLRAAEVRIHPREHCQLTLWPRRHPKCRFGHEVFDIEPLVADEARYGDADVQGLTVGEVFALAERRLGNVTAMELGHLVSRDWLCASGHSWRELRRLSIAPPRCPACGKPGMAKLPTRHVPVAAGRAVLDTPIAGAVIPAGDVIRFARADGGTAHLSLPRPVAWRPADTTSGVGSRAES